jgi:2-oxoisovalerate dehydrogenase E1 component
METSISEIEINFDGKEFSSSELLDLYRQLIYPRLVEEKMLNLLRQNKISKWFSGIGQEAISVGCTAALHPEELIFTMHRNLGVFTCRKIPFGKLFAQWQGKKSGFSKGRERSFHFGALDYGIVGMISHLGPQLALADGVALAYKLRKEKKATLVFTGEGGTSEGDFHEALNVAAVWSLPVIFAIENNGYGLSTPTSEQYTCKNLADRALGYDMRSVIVDGNNILEVYRTVKRIAEEIRQNPHPVLIEFKTFRMRGHEEASGTKYVPKELLDTWVKRDPVQNFEQYLLENGVLAQTEKEKIRKEIKAEIEAGLSIVFDELEVIPNTDEEIHDVYCPSNQKVIASGGVETKPMRLIDAISDGLRAAMRKHENLVLMGQDIAEYGGVFKITEGFVKEFGKERVRNTPLCESAIVGCALGLSIERFKSMVEMQFADFVTSGFNQIVNNLAKIHYRWGQNADVVIRMPCGAGVGAGPFHSQSNEAWFAHTPGLKVVYPSNPYDAKGLLLASFEDPNPVMFFEHKALYRSVTDDVPTEYYTIEIGKCKILREGTQATIITYGMGVHWAKKLVEEMNADIEIIDLRTLAPLDVESIRQSVSKTGKALILHEDTLFGGIGGEISAIISEQMFEQLDAPVVRVASLDTPVPFALTLEQNFLAAARLKEKLTWLLNY